MHEDRTAVAADNCFNADRVAMDLIGLEMQDVYYIKKGIAHGYGYDLDNINIVGESYEKVPYKKPSNLMNGLDKLILNLTPYIYARFLRPRAFVDRNKCQLCKSCISHCPEKIISYKNSRIWIDRKRCISCFCCQESCKFDAIKGVSGIKMNAFLKP
jgi:ferredoxin